MSRAAGGEVFRRAVAEVRACVPHDDITVDRAGGGWCPSLRDARTQQFVGCRLMIPHGDRRDGS